MQLHFLIYVLTITEGFSSLESEILREINIKYLTNATVLPKAREVILCSLNELIW